MIFKVATLTHPMADPGCPGVVGVRQLPTGVRQPINLPIFLAEKCMTMKDMDRKGAYPWCSPHGSATDTPFLWSFFQLHGVSQKTKYEVPFPAMRNPGSATVMEFCFLFFFLRSLQVGKFGTKNCIPV